MPLRSFGCYLCRKRKIRCDEGRPQCQRCITHGVQCPGYRTKRSGELEFRDQSMRVRQNAQVDILPNDQQQKRDASTLSFDGLAPSSCSRHSHCATAPHHPRHHLEDVSESNPTTSVRKHPDADPPYTSFYDLMSPAVQRQQFRNCAFSLEVPQNFLPQERSLELHHFQYARIILAMPSTQPALVHALDSLSMLQAGSNAQDCRLIHHGVELYGRALRCLADVLLRPQSLCDDSVLAAVAVLSKCEFFEEVKQNGKGWVSHQEGMQRLIDARGPSLIKSRLALLLYFFSRGGAMSKSFLLRKRDFYASSRWRLVGLNPPLDEYSTSYLLGMRITELFERHDALDWQHQHALDECDALIEEYGRLKLDMARHVATLRALILPDDVDEPVPSLRPIGSFPTFSTRVSDRTLTKAFAFPSYMAAFIHSQFWIRRYLLTSDIQRLIARRREYEPSWQSPITDDAVTQDLLGDALSLCRCVPYLVEPSNSMAGGICCLLPLYLATQYFHANRNWRWLRWVHNVKEGVFKHGLSLPRLPGNDHTDHDLSDEALLDDSSEPYIDEFHRPWDGGDLLCHALDP